MSGLVIPAFLSGYNGKCPYGLCLSESPYHNEPCVPFPLLSPTTNLISHTYRSPWHNKCHGIEVSFKANIIRIYCLLFYFN